MTLRPVSDSGAVQFKPASITITGNKAIKGQHALAFAVLPLKTGRHTIRYEITGKISCPCRPQPSGKPCQTGCSAGSGYLPLEPELLIVFNADHRSVFERLKIAVGVLPSGNHHRDVVSCPGGKSKYTLSSTDKWHTEADTKHAYSCGVIHGHVASLKIPMSIAGGRTTVDKTLNSFGPVLDSTCDKVPFFTDDVLDYLSTGSLGKAILSQLSVPKWINLQDAGLPTAKYSNKDLSVKMVKGSDLHGIKGCHGLPTEKDITYTLLQYKRAIKLDLQGVPVILQPDTTEQICVLLDMCTGGGCSRSGGVSFLIGVPESVWSAIAAHPLIQQFSQQGISFQGNY